MNKILSTISIFLFISVVSTSSYAAFTETKKVSKEGMEYQASMVSLLSDIKDEMVKNNKLQQELIDLYKQSLSQVTYKKE